MLRDFFLSSAAVCSFHWDVRCYFRRKKRNYFHLCPRFVAPAQATDQLNPRLEFIKEVSCISGFLCFKETLRGLLLSLSVFGWISKRPLRHSKKSSRKFWINNRIVYSGMRLGNFLVAALLHLRWQIQPLIFIYINLNCLSSSP